MSNINIEISDLSIYNVIIRTIRGLLKLTYQVLHGCTLCGMCETECPVGAIVVEKTGAHIDQDKCIGCGSCADNCASEAIVPVEDK